MQEAKGIYYDCESSVPRDYFSNFSVHAADGVHMYVPKGRGAIDSKIQEIVATGKE